MKGEEEERFLFSLMKNKNPIGKEEETLLLKFMEDYRDSVIPSFSELKTHIKIEENEETPFSYQLPLASNPCKKPPRLEKERRETITKLYSVLQSHLPNLQFKPSREEIIIETLNYIKHLQGTVEDLESKKRETYRVEQGRGMVGYGGPKSKVKVMVSGNLAVFGVRLEMGRGLFAKILMVFEKNRAEVLMANSSRNSGMVELTVTALVNGDGQVVDSIKKDILSLLD